ncbi:ABC-three component system middle component 1 [Novipirellula aureliae]|nr:ABC-three component system middle component 1 [Novipirellula aureliae]
MDKIAAPVGLFIKNHSSYAIQIGELGRELITGEWDDEYYGELISQWHGYQQYAAIARTWLLSDFSDDLNLFLVGPSGSKDEREWQNFSQIIERNDLVCRKIVWLPGKNDHNWSKELEEFLERTFLAEPWKASGATSGINLDALSDSMSDFEAWREVLERPEFKSEPVEHDALVSALLEADSK